MGAVCVVEVVTHHRLCAIVRCERWRRPPGPAARMLCSYPSTLSLPTRLSSSAKRSCRDARPGPIARRLNPALVEHPAFPKSMLTLGWLPDPGCVPSAML